MLRRGLQSGGSEGAAPTSAPPHPNPLKSDSGALCGDADMQSIANRPAASQEQLERATAKRMGELLAQLASSLWARWSLASLPG